MNIKNRLRHLAYLSGKDRQTGRTSLNAKAAKEADGIVLAATHAQAKMIQEAHKVPARAMEMNLDGFLGPFFFDHHAIEVILNKAANKIELLEAKNERMIKKVEALLKELKTEADEPSPPDQDTPRSGAV